eukprot:1835029-Rhodomonas_salina.1
MSAAGAVAFLFRESASVYLPQSNASCGVGHAPGAARRTQCNVNLASRQDMAHQPPSKAVHFLSSAAAPQTRATWLDRAMTH